MLIHLNKRGTDIIPVGSIGEGILFTQWWFDTVDNLSRKSWYFFIWNEESWYCQKMRISLSPGKTPKDLETNNERNLSCMWGVFDTSGLFTNTYEAIVPLGNPKQAIILSEKRGKLVSYYLMEWNNVRSVWNDDDGSWLEVGIPAYDVNTYVWPNESCLWSVIDIIE